MRRMLLALALFSASCQTRFELQPRKLPFHVAIAPMPTPDVGTTTPGELAGEPTDLRLELDAELVRERLAETLEEFCFERVSLLAAGASTAADAARSIDADLVLAVGLRYDPEVYRGRTSVFWLNIPVFFVMTPAVWLLPDNIYFADVELEVELSDLNALEGAFDGPAFEAARMIATSSRFNGVELDFLERTVTFKERALGFIWPSGYLARETDTVQAKLHEHVTAALCTQVARDLQGRQDDLVLAPAVAPVHIDPQLSIERRGDRLDVAGSVHIDEAAIRLRAIEFEAGSERVATKAFDASTKSGPHSFDFSVSVPYSDRARYLRLECEAGTRDRFFRSYTFRIPDPPQGAAGAVD